ncbi:MAG: hypothetical protein E3K37_05880 [Candidatus Kuenenia sp.]|nr:hypothetical protein [Candidatus Kuenenia hertensis]
MVLTHPIFFFTIKAIILFLRKVGNAALVKTAKGRVGWVYTKNIKEVKIAVSS